LPFSGASGASGADALIAPSGSPVGTSGPLNLPTGIKQNAQGQWQQVASPQQIQAGIVKAGKARGMSDDQIAGALAIAGGESNYGQNIYGGDQGIGGAWGTFQQGNAYGAVSDRQDPNKAINQFMDLYHTQLQAQPGLTPMQVAAGVQQHGGPGSPGSWQGTAGDQTYLSQVSAHLGEVPVTGGAPAASGAPGGGISGGGLSAADAAALGLDAGGAGISAGSGGLTGLEEPAVQGRAPAGVQGRAGVAGPWGIPAGQVSGITPITDPNLVGVGKAFGGFLPSTYPGHQVQGGLNQGIDWGAFPGWSNRPGQAYNTPVGGQIGTEAGGSRQLTREEADRSTAFAKWIGTQPGVQQVINMNPYTGEKVGYYNGQPVGPDMPGTTDPGYYRDDWTGHSQHVHTRLTQDLTPPTGVETQPAPFAGTLGDNTPNGPVDVNVAQQGGTNVPPVSTQTVAPTAGGKPLALATSPGDWMRAPTPDLAGKPVPMDVRRANGVPDDIPQIYYSSQGQPLTPTPLVTGSAAPTLQAGAPIPGMTRAGPNVPDNATAEPTASDTNQQFGAGTAQGASIGQGLSQAGAVVEDAFQIYSDVIQDIKSGADIVDTMVRGIPDTKTLVSFINDFKSFIQTGADILKTGADATGAAAGIAAGAGDFGGQASGILSAISGGLSIGSAALEAVNQGIAIAEEVWNEVSKYAGEFFGLNLGGSKGALGGNVQMLLNRQTGQILAYSQDNPLNKSVTQLPVSAQLGYGGPFSGGPQSAQMNQLNIYAGPGQSTSEMMSDAMWVVNTQPSAISVAGKL
jgi:hypothetical protein